MPVLHGNGAETRSNVAKNGFHSLHSVNDCDTPCELIKNVGGIIAVSRAISKGRGSIRKIIVSDTGPGGLAHGDGLIRLRRDERGTSEYLIPSFERKAAEFHREIFSYAMMLQTGRHIMYGTYRNRIRCACGFMVASHALVITECIN